MLCYKEKLEPLDRAMVVTLLIYCNFADWFWKKPDFSIVL